MLEPAPAGAGRRPAAGADPPLGEPVETLEAELRVLAAGAAQILPEGGLRELLARARREGRAIRIKLGIDPSSPHLHIGHAVVLRKLAQFQRCGHTVVLIIGSFTAQVGDPTGRKESRRQHTEAEVRRNATTYLEQAGRVLDVGATEVRYNADWLAALTLADVARLASTVTVAQLLEREDFRTRYTVGQPISLVEFLYPLMQGMDSIEVRADVELGGTDQTFNLLMGRELQRAYGQPGQVVLTMPLLEGTDGVQKMSKSFGNSVDLDEPAPVMFGKLMTVPDQLVPKYLQLCTDLEPGLVEWLAAEAAAGGASAARVKRRLAAEVVAGYHGRDEAARAEQAFDAGIRARAGEVAPGEEAGVALEELTVPAAAVEAGTVWAVALLAEAGLVPSRSQARRLIRAGAVRLDGERVDSEERVWAAGELDGRLLTVGRRNPVRLRER